MLIPLSLCLAVQVKSNLDAPSLAFIKALPEFKASLLDDKGLAHLYRGLGGGSLVLASHLCSKTMSLAGAGDAAGVLQINGITTYLGTGPEGAPHLNLVSLNVQQPDRPFDVANKEWIWPPRGTVVKLTYRSTSPSVQVEVSRELADKCPAYLVRWVVTNQDIEPISVGRVLMEPGIAGVSELGPRQWPVTGKIEDSPQVDALLPPHTEFRSPRAWFGPDLAQVAQFYAPWSQPLTLKSWADAKNPPTTDLDTTVWGPSEGFPVGNVEPQEWEAWGKAVHAGLAGMKFRVNWPLDEPSVQHLEAIIRQIHPRYIVLQCQGDSHEWMGWDSFRSLRTLLGYARKNGVDIAGLPVPDVAGGRTIGLAP